MPKISRYVESIGTYICDSCGKRTRETGEGESSVKLCLKCFNEASLENEHLDGFHKSNPVKGCPLCNENKA